MVADSENGQVSRLVKGRLKHKIHFRILRGNLRILHPFWGVSSVGWVLLLLAVTASVITQLPRNQTAVGPNNLITSSKWRLAEVYHLVTGKPVTLGHLDVNKTPAPIASSIPSPKTFFHLEMHYFQSSQTAMLSYINSISLFYLAKDFLRMCSVGTKQTASIRKEFSTSWPRPQAIGLGSN